MTKGSGGDEVMVEGPDLVGPCSNPTAILCQSGMSEVEIIIILK